MNKNETNVFVVYCHLFPNGKRYIGITNNITERWRKGKGYKTQTFINRAIHKYGWENIQHFILAKNLNKQQAEKLEIFFIAKYKTTERDKGYNRTYGGECNIPNEESKMLISINHADCSGENNSFYGKHHTDSTKKLISQNHNYFLQSGTKNVNAKKVICFDTLQIFACASDADAYFNICHDSTNLSCRKLKTRKGLHFMYYSDFINYLSQNKLDELQRFLNQLPFQKNKKHMLAKDLRNLNILVLIEKIQKVYEKGDFITIYPKRQPR